MHEEQPSVAIIILNWNGNKTTRECVHSLQNLDYSNYQIVIVDNNSTDGSKEVLRKEFPQHQFIENSDNLGFPGGNNEGIEWALHNRFDYVMLLNYDTVVETEFLGKLIEISETDDSIGILGPCVRYHADSTKTWSCGGHIEKKTGRPYHIHGNESESDIRTVEWLSACAMLIKSEVFREIGLLDNDYFFGTEDADFCLRASRNGYKIVYVGKTCVYHKTSFSRFRNKYKSYHHYYNMRNLLIFIKKHQTFSVRFVLSFLVSVTKRGLWSLMRLDFRSLYALWFAVYDYITQNYGKARIAL